VSVAWYFDTNTPMANEFYVLQVMTGDEKQFISLAEQAITRRLDGEAEYRFWWPRRKLMIRKKGRRRPSLAPMFPGYVFLESDHVSPPLFREIRRTTGFVRFLKSNTDIRPLSEDDAALIKHFLSFGEIVEESRVTFDENNRIVVKDGPLKGLEGLVVKVDRRKGRAKIKLDMYDNSFLIDLGFEIMAPGKEPVGEASA
jgi:transcriptional antiterminator NusG